MTSIYLEWTANPAEDNITRYEIERRTIDPSQKIGIGKVRRALGTNLWGGWRSVGEVPGSQTNFSDTGRMPVRRIFRPTYTRNSEVLPYQSYEYRIRAVNNQGTKGPWVHCRVDPAAGTLSGEISGIIVNQQAVLAAGIVTAFPLTGPDHDTLINSLPANPNLGLNHAIEVLDAAGNSIPAANITVNANGTFSITNVPLNVRITLRSPAQAGFAQAEHTAGWPTSQIQLDNSNPTLEEVVIPKNAGSGGGPVVADIPKKRVEFEKAMNKWEKIMENVASDGMDYAMCWHWKEKTKVWDWFPDDEIVIVKSIKEYLESIISTIKPEDKLRAEEIIKYLEIAITYWGGKEETKKKDPTEREKAKIMLGSKTHRQFHDEIMKIVQNHA